MKKPFSAVMTIGAIAVGLSSVNATARASRSDVPAVPVFFHEPDTER